MAGKEYVVVRKFTRVDPKTGIETRFKKNDVYDGPVDKSYLDPGGPDGKGPLLAEKSTTPEKPSPLVAGSDSSTKEKK